MSIVERGRTYFRSDTSRIQEAATPIGVAADERKRRRKPTVEFDIPNDVERSLSKEQTLLLNELRRVARRLGDLYLAQEERSFWPKDISDSEIEEASKENPEITSPYTYVVREDDGQLRTIPIHEVFRDMIRDKQIVTSLKRAADLSGKGRSKDLVLQAYLRARAKAFENGNWEYSESLWLQMPNLPQIFIVIGPYDNYLDPHKMKYAWESWVGVLDEPQTQKAQKFVDEFLTWREQETGEKRPIIRARADHTVVMSGQPERKKWVGNSLPCQMNLRKELGSVYFIFGSAFEDKFKGETLPAFRSFIHYSKRSGVTDDMVRDANRTRYNAHEISHSLVADDISQRLKGSSAWIKELYCDLLALKGSFALSKSKREKELLFAATFVNGIAEYFNYQSGNEDKLEYLIGSTIMLGYCLRHEVIRIDNGVISWENPDRVIDKLLELFDIVDGIQRDGTRVDSHGLHKEYYDSRIYEEFRTEPKVPAHMLK